MLGGGHEQVGLGEDAGVLVAGLDEAPVRDAVSEPGPGPVEDLRPLPVALAQDGDAELDVPIGQPEECVEQALRALVVLPPRRPNDVRTMPGETPDDVRAQLSEAMGDLADEVEISPIMNDMSTTSPIDTPLWDSLRKAVRNAFPKSELAPGLVVGFTDARVHRQLGAVSYGAGLLSPDVSAAEFGSRFHGNNERIDVESIGLTTGLYLDTITDLLG